MFGIGINKRSCNGCSCFRIGSKTSKRNVCRIYNIAEVGITEGTSIIREYIFLKPSTEGTLLSFHIIAHPWNAGRKADHALNELAK